MYKKLSFTVKVPVDLEDENNKETKEVKLDVKTPNLKQINEAQLACNRGFDAAMRSKAPLRIEIDSLLKERGIWTKTKEEELEKHNKELAGLVNKLRGGGMKLLEARDLALKIKDMRDKIASLNTERRVLDTVTAEAQSETARFNWFVANCTVYSETGELFFPPATETTETGTRVKDSVEVYLEQSGQEYAQECARQFGILQYGLDPDFEKKFPENEFLLKFKFVRPKDLRLINREGHLINREGQLVDEEGYLVDKDDKRIDRTGVRIDKEGVSQLPAQPFLDEDGQEITV